MRIRLMPALAAGLAALLCLSPAAAAGGLRSFKGPLVKDQETSVSVENAGLKIVSYRFSRQPRGAEKIFKIGSGPNISFVVRNEGSVPRGFAMAVALFDQAGLLVGAGADDISGKLDPGEEKEIKVVFKGVNQNVASAASMQVSLEIQL